MQQQQHPVQMSVGQVPPGAAMVYMPASIAPKTYDRYKHKQSIGLGITQVVIGLLCVIFNSVVLGVYNYPGNGLGAVGHGYWCGIMFTITGIFGVLAGRKKTRCQIVTFMVLCIISASFTIALLTVGIIGASTAQYSYCPSYGYYYNSYPYYSSPCYAMQNYATIVAMESLLAICALVEAVVAIWGSALCCGSGVCCCSKPMTVLSSAGYSPTTGQVIYISQTHDGQYVYPPQPATCSYNQGMTQPHPNVQSGWAMPTTNIGPVLPQAPPGYTTSQAQQVWMVAPSRTNQSISAGVQAPSTYPAQSQTKYQY